MTDLTGALDRRHRPGPRAWGQLVVAEMRMVARDTSGLVVPLGLPLLILVMSGMGAAGQEIPGLGGLTALEAYVVPLAMVIVIAMIGVVNMPSFLAMYRQAGILRRLAATPAHPLMVLGAQVVTSVIQTVVGIGLALTVGAAAFDLQAPRQVAAAVGLVVLVAAAMYALGMVVAALAPTTNASVALGLVLFFAMGATGGLFGGMDTLPEPMARIGEVLPFGAGVLALQAAWTGTGVGLLHLGSLVVTTVVAAAVATATFRWDR